MTPDRRRRLVLATTNPGKVAELVALLGDQFAVEARPEDLEDTVEDADTLAGNARKKACDVAAATGAAALSDDTGLFVAALGGRPGVHTARFAGPDATSADNIAALLDALADVEDRRAHFRTVIALIDETGAELTAEGRVDGVITRTPSGGEGFGYDPVFVPDEGDGRTFAEMSREEKAALSHRGRALERLLELISAEGWLDRE